MKNKAEPKDSSLSSNEVIEFMEAQAEIETERVRNLDELALYDEMTVGVLGALKKDLAAGMSAEEIMAKYANLAAARITSIAATEADSGKALAAAKDILDRVKGKAVERKQIHHKLENVDEKQIDAIIMSELENLQIEDTPEEE